MIGLKNIIRFRMFEETKIIINILKRYFLFIFILPILPSLIIFFYSKNYDMEFVKLYQFSIYTETINRENYSKVDEIIYKIENTIQSYDKTFIQNKIALKTLKKSENIVLGDMFREFILLLNSNDQIMRNLHIESLDINTLVTSDFYNRTFEINDLNKLKIDFLTTTTDKYLIKSIFSNVIELINSMYSKKIHENNKLILSSIRKDVELYIQTNDNVLTALKKQLDFLKNQNQKDLNEMTEIELEIIFLNDLKQRLIVIIDEIDEILNENFVNLKMINDIWDVQNTTFTKQSFLITYMYILSYFLFLVLFLFLSVIYEYNYKRKI